MSDVPARRKAHCGYCHLEGHYAKTCSSAPPDSLKYAGSYCIASLSIIDEDADIEFSVSICLTKKEDILFENAVHRANKYEEIEFENSSKFKVIDCHRASITKKTFESVIHLNEITYVNDDNVYKCIIKSLNTMKKKMRKPRNKTKPKVLQENTEEHDDDDDDDAENSLEKNKE